jgi:dolichol-phosphate mannosyltransferase
MLYFLIPVFNESLNLGQLAENLKAVMPGEEKFYLFVDDGSTDDTVSKASSLFSNEQHHIITKEKNAGPGHSFNLGFMWITEHSKDDNDLTITIEADNTSDLGILPRMIAIARMDYDLVLASVYAQGGGFEKSSLFRKIISFSANFFLRFAFNIRVQTLSSFYRVYSLKLLRKIRGSYAQIISENGFVCMFEILLKAVKQEASVIEVPVKLRSTNRKGKSKMKIIRTMRQYLRFTFKASFRGL